MFGLNNDVIDSLLRDLLEEFVLQDQGSIDNFLGIHIERTLNKSSGIIDHISLTQTGLIDSILWDPGLLHDNNCNEPRDPANPWAIPISKVLHPSPDSKPYNATAVNYCSIISKLNFLAQNTWPDIAYAINSCARFLNNPNKMHFLAVKQIGCYLLVTWDRGMIIHPTNKNHLGAYIDSDFAGSWSKETSHLWHSALSHTGYVITYSSCPIHWVSKLQSKIALSTCEAECIALSMCTWALPPLWRVLDDITKWFLEPNQAPRLSNLHITISTKQLQSVICKDNAACLEIANDPVSLTGPRTRHLHQAPSFRKV